MARGWKRGKRNGAQRAWKSGMVWIVAVMMLVAGCGSGTIGKEPMRPADPGQPREFAVDRQEVMLPLETHGQGQYVSLHKLTEALGFESIWDAERAMYSFGDHNPEYQVEADSEEAMKDGDAIRLPDPPILLRGTLYLPVSAIPPMFGQEMSFRMTQDQLMILSNPYPPVQRDDGSIADETPLGELDFAEEPEGSGDGANFGVVENPGNTKDSKEAEGSADPGDSEGSADPGDSEGSADPGDSEGSTDPGDSEGSANVPRVSSPGRGNFKANAISAQAANIDKSALVRAAQKYKGVKYEFGADPFPVSGKFDCSSFTRFLYKKYGVSLPRTARSQAKRGRTIGRKQLRKGDLLFFYVPGRFKTNQTVGHVGIYMGGMKMIHASPEPRNGVQISGINNAYWKKTFLKATRITG